MAQSDLARKLKGTSFEKRKHTEPRRIVIDMCAQEGQGKTHFGFTAPSPILYPFIDHGHEGVITKFSKSEIWDAHYTANVDPYSSNKERTEAAEAEWIRFRTDFVAGIAAGARSIVLDTAGEFYELLRLARFGKLEQVPSHFYGVVKREWSSLERRVCSAHTIYRPL